MVSSKRTLDDTANRLSSLNSYKDCNLYIAITLCRFAKIRDIANFSSLPYKYKSLYFNMLCELTKEFSNTTGFNEYLLDIKSKLKLDKVNRPTKGDKTTDKFYTVIKNLMPLYTLILESGYILSLTDDFNISKWINFTRKKFTLDLEIANHLEKILFSIKNKKIDILLDLYNSAGSFKYLQESIKFEVMAIIKILKYELLNIKHVAVISTMSSGKSTFINALLGNEIFPETQAACTAKITSIYDNDDFNDISGVALYKNKVVKTKISSDRNMAKIWNDDNNIDRIVFEGNLKNIFNHNQVVAIHDTPGTNFSSDEEHKKITLNFLKDTKLDVVIFLINAMYAETNDLLDLLKQIFEITKNKNVQILFVLNKIDAIDTQRESLDEIIKNAKKFIQNIGFVDPILIATSTKAARLFKMALDNTAYKFSENEVDDFRIFLRKFAEEKNTYLKNCKIKIDAKEYFKEEISSALKNTDFHSIEKIINGGY